MKPIIKGIDWTLGAFLRFVVYHVLRPVIWLKFNVTIEGGEEALACKDGALVIARHYSMGDGPFLIALARPYVRIRATAKYAQYMRPFFRPFMLLFGIICLGSPKHWSPERRAAVKAWAIEVMKKVLRAGRYLLVFAEGVLGDGKTVKIDERFSGVFELITAFPNKPVIIVDPRGLQFAPFAPLSERKNFFKRIPVHVKIGVFRRVDTGGSPAALNKRLEDYFNLGVPLPTLCAVAV